MLNWRVYNKYIAGVSLMYIQYSEKRRIRRTFFKFGLESFKKYLVTYYKLKFAMKQNIGPSKILSARSYWA